MNVCFVIGSLTLQRSRLSITSGRPSDANIVSDSKFNRLRAPPIVPQLAARPTQLAHSVWLVAALQSPLPALPSACPLPARSAACPNPACKY